MKEQSSATPGRPRASWFTVLPLAIAAVGLLAAAPVQASSAQTVLQQGRCSLNSTWKVTMAYTDLGKIEAAFEVDSNKAGQPWHVTLKHNGTVYFSGSRTTLADGSFEISRIIPNLSGVDTISGVATNPATGEVCSGSASL